MRTQTKIRNIKILGHVFNLLFFIAVAYLMALCYQKFQDDNRKAAASLTPSEAAQSRPSTLNFLNYKRLGEHITRSDNRRGSTE